MVALCYRTPQHIGAEQGWPVVDARSLQRNVVVINLIWMQASGLDITRTGGTPVAACTVFMINFILTTRK